MSPILSKIVVLNRRFRYHFLFGKISSETKLLQLLPYFFFKFLLCSRTDSSDPAFFLSGLCIGLIFRYFLLYMNIIQIFFILFSAHFHYFANEFFSSESSEIHFQNSGQKIHKIQCQSGICYFRNARYYFPAILKLSSLLIQQSNVLGSKAASPKQVIRKFHVPADKVKSSKNAPQYLLEKLPAK